MATGSKKTINKGTETKIHEPTVASSADQTPKIVGPITHNDIISPPLTDAQAIVQQNNNDTHAVSKKDVTELRAEVPPLIVAEMRVCAQASFALRVHCSGKA